MKLNKYKNIIIFFLSLSFFIVSAFYLPRILVLFLGENHFLSSYLYIYISGMPFFMMGIYLIIKSQALNFKIPGEKRWIVYFFFTTLFVCAIHGLIILAAIKIPFKG